MPPEQNTETTAPEWVSNISDDGLKTTLSQFESPDAFFKAAGIEAPKAVEKDWREQITEEDGKKFAERYTDLNAFTKGALDLRKQLSNAIVRPGKDAKPEQIAAYNKALGIPEKPEEYEFSDLPTGKDLTDEAKQSRQEWATRFHSLGVSKTAAKELSKLMTADITKAEQAQAEADKAFATAQESKLRDEWKGDFDKNKTMANRAYNEIAQRAGISVEELGKIETKDGRFLMDNADIVRLFAVIGREMSEGSLGPILTESEKETLGDELHSLRKQISEAQAEGDSKRANLLYQRELALVAKMDGDKPLVGSQARAA